MKLSCRNVQLEQLHKLSTLPYRDASKQCDCCLKHQAAHLDEIIEAECIFKQMQKTAKDETLVCTINHSC